MLNQLKNATLLILRTRLDRFKMYPNRGSQDNFPLFKVLYTTILKYGLGQSLLSKRTLGLEKNKNYTAISNLLTLEIVESCFGLTSSSL